MAGRNMWKVVTLSCVSGAVLFLYFAKRSYSGTRCSCTERLDGKLIIITGGNSGIGKATASILAAKGAKVILACRNKRKGDEAAKEIIKNTGNTNIRCEELDLADLRSIVNFADTFNDKESQLYALINNAGIFHHPFQLTKDGFELTFQTNYLGPFLLTLLMLDVLKKDAPSKIVNVSSEAHKFPKTLDISRLHLLRSKFDEFMVYGESKLCIHLFTKKLSCIFKGKGVTINCVNPGNTRSKIYRSFPFLKDLPLFSINRFFYWLQFKNCWEGAQTVVHVILDPKLAADTGKYYSDCTESEASSLTNSEELVEQLWDNTLDWLKDYLPKTTSTVFLR